MGRSHFIAASNLIHHDNIFVCFVIYLSFFFVKTLSLPFFDLQRKTVKLSSRDEPDKRKQAVVR